MNSILDLGPGCIHTRCSGGESETRIAGWRWAAIALKPHAWAIARANSATENSARPET